MKVFWWDYSTDFMDSSSSAQQGGWVAVGLARVLSNTGRLHVCVQVRQV